ncbi:uncharacterized protein LOC122093331 [Macadamia integrifolia]|uniref:uncharacterized protein LOC122093331 n=1 Tax=Macadamia integrifolia TaxID=60698 RepID=UPI001C5333D2|nr:uncharacterized protein LOC122093331 [Macadamia integrifolia]
MEESFKKRNQSKADRQRQREIMLPRGENLFRSSSFLVVFAMAMTLMFFTAESRYLRPSDHGLVHQNNSTAMKSPEMKSFFDGASTELPEAKNTTKPWWRNNGAPATFLGRDNGRKDRMREVLLISSLACGIAGVALMVAAAFIYFFHRRRSSSQSASSCKQIVVRTD